MQLQNVKLVVFVPASHGDVVRKTLGEAGAGIIGNYTFCSFTSKGIGRFMGNEKTKPAIGQAQKYESVEEERIETVVPRAILKDIVKKLQAIHPYEEMAFDVYPLKDI
jgi:hypothetical protein